MESIDGGSQLSYETIKAEWVSLSSIGKFSCDFTKDRILSWVVI